MMLHGSVARRLRRSRRFRPLGIAAYRMYLRIQPAHPGPRVLANSLPKAGTHLLMSLLDAIPGVRFSGRHCAYGELVGAGDSAGARLGEIRAELSRLRTSQYMTGHIRHDPDTSALIRTSSCRNLFVVRDPRDVVVSQAMYLASNPLHPLHGRVMEDFPGVDERVRAVVTGFPADARSRRLVSLAERLDHFSGWLDDPDTCVVRFEDLVGPQGGGSAEQQLGEVRRVLRFLSIQHDDVALRNIVSAAYSAKSVTFRRGQIGSWRDELNPQLLSLIEETCGEQLVRYGYPR